MYAIRSYYEADDVRDAQHMHGVDIRAIIDVRRVVMKQHTVAKPEDHFLPAFKLTSYNFV